MPAESFELGTLLRHGTAYELVDFLTRLQVSAVARMAQEHAELQVIERALDNEPASDDEPKLQKVGRKRALKKRRTRIELPELNTALVETYKELDYATRAAKDMAENIKIARQHAKTAINLWQTSEAQRAELERKLNMVPPAPPTALAPPSVDASTQTEPPPTDITENRLVSTETQTEPINASIIQLEDEIASYKAIADMDKEWLEASRWAAEEREATLQTTIQDQRTQLTEADEKFNTAISSFQDIATAQIASLTQELRATQGTSAMFLMKYETAEREHARLYEDLLEHQTTAMCEHEA